MRPTALMLALLCLAPVPALAQGQGQIPCAPHAEMLATIAEQFGEHPVSRGVTLDGGHVMEVLASKSGTWTLLMSDVRGMSCAVMAGEGWQGIEPPEPGQGS